MLGSMIRAPGLAAMAILAVTASCAGALPPNPDMYRTWRAPVDRHGMQLNVTFVEPVRPRHPGLLVLFASGDAGWRGASGDLLAHLAQEGYALAAYDAREIVHPLRRSGKLKTISEAASLVDALIVHAREALKLPATTRIVVTGFSRGANFVVFTAGAPSLQHHLLGAVAIALTRETDFLQAPPPGARSPQMQVDAKGRIQTYPALALAGPIPVAVIQSTKDPYVGAEEARQLFGPDTATRRLYAVDARNHDFGGNRTALLQDLDDAMRWIELQSH